MAIAIHLTWPPYHLCLAFVQFWALQGGTGSGGPTLQAIDRLRTLTSPTGGRWVTASATLPQPPFSFTCILMPFIQQSYSSRMCFILGALPLGFQARLVYYTERDVTLENALLVATYRRRSSGDDGGSSGGILGTEGAPTDL